ncbi:hypothetical protein BDP55DRAFT_323835 [Colletotrichum godetiae]|uniref:Uncharacterized protein n=1 Tax=Colletotrichum godetiae TaxID=1209918 RepID=A0AAJ0EQZ4_9PEZI|nr:uncharacterized protein BDP55DRAFT_323835 [Colletotrichum godetiae]KAK1660032.1 hypothetical protein BDP55DRAFT_323835 [Colletotrichum godetiae]
MCVCVCVCFVPEALQRALCCVGGQVRPHVAGQSWPRISQAHSLGGNSEVLVACRWHQAMLSEPRRVGTDAWLCMPCALVREGCVGRVSTNSVVRETPFQFRSFRRASSCQRISRPSFCLDCSVLPLFLWYASGDSLRLLQDPSRASRSAPSVGDTRF